MTGFLRKQEEQKDSPVFICLNVNLCGEGRGRGSKKLLKPEN